MLQILDWQCGEGGGRRPENMDHERVVSNWLFDAINALLPEEGRAMLLEYSETLGATHQLEVAMLTETAFLDGVRLVLRALGD